MATTTTTNGSHITDEVITTDITRSASPGLLRSHVDERVCRIRPSSTPLDQLSRMVGARHAGSMKVDYYSVDVRPGSVKVSGAVTLSASQLAEGGQFSVKVENLDLIAVSDTVLFPTVMLAEKSTGMKRPLTGYVKDKTRDAVTVVTAGSYSDTAAAIAAGDEVVRMGRAAGELDVQTPLYQVLPVKDYNYCQIFKAQIEESVLQRLSDKEVGWTFTDQEESAIVDMRMGMEKSFLFGTRARVSLADGDVLLTGGIWGQAGREYEYTVTDDKFDDLNGMLRAAFCKGGGSSRKVLLAGSDLIAKLAKQDLVRTADADRKKTVWGIDFDCITSKFGTVYVKLSEIFDLCGMAGCGIIIDPEYITKYSHIPFSAERISFHSQGTRNTEAEVLTEASCLVLRHPEAHTRIVPKATV